MGGKTYKENIRLIPIRNDGIVLAYVKFEIEVKTGEFLAGKVIPYTITHDERFELNDYIGKDVPKGGEEPEDSFFAVASNRPKRAEIVYRCKFEESRSETLCQFGIQFKCPVKCKIYNQRITLCFVPYSKEPKENIPSSTAIEGKIDISVVTDKK